MITLEPAPHMHERTVEERIAFRQQPDRPSSGKMRRDTLRRAVIETADLRLIGRIGDRHLFGDGIFQPQLTTAGIHQRRDDPAGMALHPALSEERHHIDRPDQAGRAQREVTHVAVTNADAVQRAGIGHARDGVEQAHSASLAMAFTAATAIALPPLRPFTIRYGTRPSAASASFDSRAPTKPTAVPITAAGRGAPWSSI